jgi:putative ABC transport system permease protein
MLQNYFKVALRNISRHRFYSFINVFGLTTGIAVSMLIAFYVFDELSYDKFHTDADRIHQLYLKAMIQGKPEEGANTCAPIAAASREELAGVEDAVRIALWRGQVFPAGRQYLY